MFDVYTLNHMNAWLDNHLRGCEEEKARIRERLMDLVLEHPDLLDRGWRELVDLLDRNARDGIK